MALTGVDPTDPTPGHRRQLRTAQGDSAGSAPSYKVLLFGNKTSAGSETVDTLNLVVADHADMVARFGINSELTGMYDKFNEVNKTAEIYAIAVTESVGGQAVATFTMGGGPATAAATATISVDGDDYPVAIAEGDTAADFALACRSAFANIAEGTCQVIATGATTAVICTYVHAGPRGGLVIGASAAVGVRITIDTATSITVTKGSLTAGTTEDDAAAAFVAAAAGEFDFWVAPWHTTSSLSATDGQIGEALAGTNGIKTEYLPLGGKEQTLHIGLVGTQAQATTVATSAAANTHLAYFYRAENNDWSPGKIAAYHAAVQRILVVAHPAQNGVVGYTSTTETVYNVRDPYTKADRPTAAEIKADLNNGVTPIAFRTSGQAYIPRIITSYSENSSGAKDYRSREGHITWVIAFFWSQVEQAYSRRLQPNIADNPGEGQIPVAKTTYPQSVVSIIVEQIRDMAGSTPIGNLYNGPILAPDKVAQMIASVRVDKITGGFNAFADIFAVEHLIKSGTEISDVSAAY